MESNKSTLCMHSVLFLARLFPVWYARQNAYKGD